MAEGNDTRFYFESGINVTLPPSATQEFRFHCFTNGENQEEISALMSVAKTSGVLFDVGAHQGMFSLLFCVSHPQNRSIAYEPSPSLARTGRELFHKNGILDRAEYVEAALGSREEERQVWFPDDAFMSLEPHGAKTVGTLMKFVTIDSEASRLATRPTVIKIDVEGFEWEVLQGAVETLRNDKPIVFLELHLDLLDKRGISPSAVCLLLNDLGYCLHDCLGNRLSLSAGYNGFSALRRFVWQHPEGIRWSGLNGGR